MLKRLSPAGVVVDLLLDSVEVDAMISIPTWYEATTRIATYWGVFALYLFPAFPNEFDTPCF